MQCIGTLEELYTNLTVWDLGSGSDCPSLAWEWYGIVEFNVPLDTL